MPDPAWASSPPEVNHSRLAGAGAGGTATTLVSGTAWQAVTASSEASCAASAANTACAASGFEGVGGAASAAMATELNGALHLLAAWAQEKTAIAAAAVSAYETAISAMIPAAVSIANRTEQAADVAINPAVFGALTPAIIALDTTYFGEHWPHNAAVGSAYGAALAALTAALAIPPPLLVDAAPMASPLSAAGSLTQAAADEATKVSGKLAHRTDVPQEATAGAFSRALSGLTTPIGSVGGLPQQGMFQPATQALTGLADSVDLTPPEVFDDSSAVPIAGAPRMPALIPGAAGAGQIGAPVTAGMGSGLTATTYAKPALAFPAESGGRPVGLRAGEPLSTRPLGPMTAGAGIAPVPLAAKDRSQSATTGLARARVLVDAEPQSDPAPNI